MAYMERSVQASPPGCENAEGVLDDTHGPAGPVVEPLSLVGKFSNFTGV